MARNKIQGGAATPTWIQGVGDNDVDAGIPVLLYDANGSPLLRGFNEGLKVDLVAVNGAGVPVTGAGNIKVAAQEALPAGTNNIGDVDVLTEPSGTGAYTTPTHTTATAGVATSVALAANASRLYALLINDSDTTIYINLGAAAVLNQGIRLNANGGSYEMSKKLGNLYTGAINAIHGSTGNKVLLVTEGV